MMYRPSNSITERLKALFKRRIADGEIAYLGDSILPGARVDVPGRPGYVYVRFPYGRDANGFTLFTAPTMARSSGAAYLDYPGSAVVVAVKYNNELEIVSAHYPSLDRAGINTSTLNPLNKQSKFVYPYQLTYGLASAVATTATASTLVMVKKLRYLVGNKLEAFDTPLAADKIDLASYIPAVDMHCYAAVWIDTYTNTAVVTTSVAQSLFTPLDDTDLQELVVRTASSRPADGIPLKAFYLSNDQSTIVQNALDVDLRQWLDNPQAWGFPNVLTTLERLRPYRTLVTGPYTTSGVGALAIELGAQVIIAHKNNLDATTAPAITDDSGDGYTVESEWYNKTTGILYVAADVTLGAAVWNAVVGFGAGTVTSVGGTSPIASSGGATPVISLNDTAVTPGSYTNASFTVDQKGRLTAASSGTASGSPPFADTTDLIKGSADATKLLRFEVDGFTTGTTRILTPPNYDGTIATLAGTEQLDNKTLPSPVINTGVSGSAIIDDATFASPSSTTVPTTNAVKGYVDQTVLGLNAKADVRLATAAALATNIYSNGSSGIGATLTGVATGVLTIDGVAVALNDRLLIKDEVTGANNGIYRCSVAGAIGVVYVLTRTTDGDTDSELRGGWMISIEGTANGTQAWVNTNVSAITFGTTAITFGEFSAGVIAVGTGLTKTGNTISLITPVTIANGGTGQTSQTPAFDALAPTTTQGDMIYHDGTDNVRLPKGTALQQLRVDSAATALEWFTPTADTNLIAIIRDEKATTVNGGTSVTTTWNARDLNTELYDPGSIVSISSNQFTPIAGDYEILVFAPFLGGAAGSSVGRCRLYNVTSAVSVEEGMGTRALQDSGAVVVLNCKFTANGSHAYRIDTYTSVGRATNGLGPAVGDGSAEVYTCVMLRKVA